MPANPAATAVTTASTPPKNKGKKRGRFTRADISRLVLFALIFAISLILGIHGKKAADLIAAAVTIILSAAVLWILVPILIRQLADRGWFFLRVPEMRAAPILCDKRIHTIFISVSDVHRSRFEKLVDKAKKTISGVRLRLLPPGKGLVWIGVPWQYQQYEWYEKSDEVENPEVDPQRLLNLSERIFDFEPDAVDTAEPIEVAAKLTVYYRVHDPYRVLFGVRYYLEAIQLEIASRWRKVISLLHYFQYIRTAGVSGLDLAGKTPDQIAELMAYLEVDPEIIKKAHRRLLTDLWLAALKKKIFFDSDGKLQEDELGEEAVPWDITDPVVLNGVENGFDVYDDFTGTTGNRVYVKGKTVKEKHDEEKVVVDFALLTNEQGPVVDPDHRVVYTYTEANGAKTVKRVFYRLGIPATKAVRRILEDWGVALQDVEVTDIEPKEPTIREALSERFKARANAMALKEEASGKKAANILEGQGVKERRRLEGEGEKAYRESVLKGDALGYTAQLKALGIPKGKGAEIVLIAEAMRRIAEKTPMTVMAGSGTGWTDLFGSIPVVQKLWSGKPPTTESLINTLASMSPTDLAKVKNALAKLEPEA